MDKAEKGPMTTDNCEHIQKVAQYLNGTLATPDAVEFETHIGNCEACTQELSRTLDSGAEPEWLRLLKSQAIALPPASIEKSADATARYSKVRIAGTGGMSVVWEGWDRATQQTVAMKFLNARYSSVPGLQRLIQEATALKRLTHTNIVNVHALIANASEPVLVMEFVEGMTLSKWQQGQPIAPADASEILLAIAAALDHAHSNGVIHRDLKPSNILLQSATPRVLPRGDGNKLLVKLSDFGLAKISGDCSLTATGEKPGTPGYMAPEQLSADDQSSHSSDIYSAGVLLYELLTGRPPFIASDPGVVLLLIQAADPTPPRMLLPMIPVDIETICLKCMCREPEGRYGTAAELSRDLQSFLDGRPISARPPGMLEKFRKWARRNRTLATLLITTLAGLTATCALSLIALNGHINARRLADEAKLSADRATQKEKDLRERAELAEVNARQKAELESVLRGRHQDVLLKVMALADNNLKTAAQNKQPQLPITGNSLLNPDFLATEVLRDYVLFLTDSSKPLDWNDLELTIRYLTFKSLAGSFTDIDAVLASVDEALSIFEDHPRDPLLFVDFVRVRQNFFTFDMTQSEVLQENFLQWMRIADQFLDQARGQSSDINRAKSLLAARDKALVEARAMAMVMKQIPAVTPVVFSDALQRLMRAHQQPLPHDLPTSLVAMVDRLHVLCDNAATFLKLSDTAKSLDSLQSAREYLEHCRNHIPAAIVLQFEKEIQSIAEESGN